MALSPKNNIWHNKVAMCVGALGELPWEEGVEYQSGGDWMTWYLYYLKGEQRVKKVSGRIKVASTYLNRNIKPKLKYIHPDTRRKKKIHRIKKKKCFFF